MFGDVWWPGPCHRPCQFWSSLEAPSKPMRPPICPPAPDQVRGDFWRGPQMAVAMWGCSTTVTRYNKQQDANKDSDSLPDTCGFGRLCDAINTHVKSPRWNQWKCQQCGSHDLIFPPGFQLNVCTWCPSPRTCAKLCQWVWALQRGSWWNPENSWQFRILWRFRFKLAIQPSFHAMLRWVCTLHAAEITQIVQWQVCTYCKPLGSLHSEIQWGWGEP